MAIVGSILKRLIDLRDNLVSEPDAQKAQEEVLQKLLKTAKDTEFGKHYNFGAILESVDMRKTFAEKIPYFDYHKLEREWWYKVHNGEENITWPGRPPYFALSSGTTGKSSKRIPVTSEMVEAIRKAGIKQVSALSNFDLPPDFFEKEIMMLGSSTDLQKEGDHHEGEISGISASNIPFWFRGYYKPGEDIAKIEEWDERVQRIAENAKNWDIGALSGIPSWLELMMKKVIEYNNLDNIHDIWPNLQVFTSGGVAFEPYEKSFNALLGHPITVIDTYLASEGFLAFQARPETNAMKLILDNGIYFEFVPFKAEYIKQDGSLVEDAPVISLADVKEDEDYVLLISTVSGAWRYLIGDTIKFTDVSRNEIRITGRTKFFLNVVGSQLSVNKMNDAVQELEENFDIKIPEFTLAAVRIDGEFHHHWYLGTETDISEEKLAEALDESLKKANKNYRVARSKALKGVKVSKVHPEMFPEWNATNKKKGGQVKMEKVMNEEKFAEWEKFVKKNKSKFL
ncbi:MAG: GH3 auxin-responsive promoter family protein [Salegentibacter sp.]|uniref:GH3 auxin-responsive promoter n=1 Tax=Salegentibacter flavus TaxID=287099 RepID=A0A1I5BBT0_9FLAO|nr:MULTISPECIES: GH3 auxin-responsive promoter family protein [Salegentibacter]MDR9457269.1 GH3 auxin-responsive promoter family protein [Salegentibacter sp.]SFN72165.1 GH3 auxin-responsive promoter [Salegentibacter flavus]